MASVRKNSFQSHLLYSAPALFDKRPRFGGLQRRRCRRRRRRTAEGAATDPRPKRGARSDYHNMPPRGGTSSTDQACHCAAPRPCGRDTCRARFRPADLSVPVKHEQNRLRTAYVFPKLPTSEQGNGYFGDIFSCEGYQLPDFFLHLLRKHDRGRCSAIARLRIGGGAHWF